MFVELNLVVSCLEHCTKIISYARPGVNQSTTAGSFIRPSRPADKPQNFGEALKNKYASETSNEGPTQQDQIRISGKTVEEVGFEKIRRQLASLQELRIVILDSLCIAGVRRTPFTDDMLPKADDTEFLILEPENELLNDHGNLRSSSPNDGSPESKRPRMKVVELDLSRNLFEHWADVAAICSRLTSLRSLKFKYVLSNRLRIILLNINPQRQPVEILGLLRSRHQPSILPRKRSWSGQYPHNLGSSEHANIFTH